MSRKMDYEYPLHVANAVPLIDIMRPAGLFGINPVKLAYWSCIALMQCTKKIPKSIRHCFCNQDVSKNLIAVFQQAAEEECYEDRE
jgi:hypothetical protein